MNDRLSRLVFSIREEMTPRMLMCLRNVRDSQPYNEDVAYCARQAGLIETVWRCSDEKLRGGHQIKRDTARMKDNRPYALVKRGPDRLTQLGEALMASYVELDC